MCDRTLNTPLSPQNESVFTDLHVLNDAVRYRKWLYSLIKPHLGRHILEVGSGIGNYTDMLLDRPCIVATDFDQAYVNVIEEKYRQKNNVHVFQLDLDNISRNSATMLQGFSIDTVINMNVLEHIKDDIGALDTLKKILVGNGKIITVVPSFQELYGSLDKAYGHYRRYRKADFAKIADELDLSLVHSCYFNFIGIFGWIYSNKIKKSSTLSKKYVDIFDRWVVPFISLFEKKIPMPIGLSLIAVLQKH